MWCLEPFEREGPREINGGVFAAWESPLWFSVNKLFGVSFLTPPTRLVTVAFFFF